MIEIRQATPQDDDAIYDVVQNAFATAEHRDGTEQDLVVALRGSARFVPELSLVAVEDGAVVGYALFTVVRIGEAEELALAPLAVLPQHQRRGVGGRLIEAGHRVARARGFHYVVVLGSAAYYPRFGYVPAARFGIRAPFEAPSENFMAVELNAPDGDIRGVVDYAREFDL
ncbi:MAG: GNAT family N-acetyltransferase [Kiritimatiellia bacterium]